MMRVLCCIEEEYIPFLDASHPLTGTARCSVNLIRGGSQINVIPESCVIQIDRRVVPGEDGGTTLPAVEKLLERLRSDVPSLRVRQHAPFLDPAMVPLRLDEILAWLRPILDEQGLPCEPEGAPYGTHGGNYTAGGIPAVVIGPGDIAQAHTVDEWIELSQIEAGLELYGAMMRRRVLQNSRPDQD